MRLILVFMAALSLLLACGQESSPPSAETASPDFAAATILSMTR